MNFSRLLLSLLGCSFAGFASAQFNFTPLDGDVLQRPSEVTSCEAQATGLSADGLAISGYRLMWWPQGHPSFGPELEAVVFRFANGAWTMTRLGDLDDDGSEPDSQALAISGDGKRPLGVGSGVIDGYFQDWPILFSPIELIPSLPNAYDYPNAKAINYDGSVIVGYGTGSYTNNPYDPSQTFWHRWKNGSIETFTPLGSGGYPTAVSWDGEVFTGYTHLDMEQNYQSWRYRPGFGFDFLPKPLIFRYFQPQTISGNGQVIAGYGDQDYTSYAWYHTDATGTVVVPGPGHRYNSRFRAANQDGSVLVGYCLSDSSDVDPLVWTPHSGPVNLTEYLIQNGIDPGVYDLRTATGVSADGTVICGEAYKVDPVTGDKDPVPFVVNIEIPQGIVDFSLTKSSVIGGTTLQGTVNLFKTATQDEVVQLSSENPAIVSVPASVTVPAGSKLVRFTITTHAVGANTPVHVTAKYGNASRTEGVDVLAPTLKALRVGYVGSPEPLDAGKPANGTVSLTGPAPAGGIAVKVWDNAGLFSLPNSESEAATVLVPEGETVGKFIVQTNATATPMTKNVYARHGSVFQTVSLSVKPWYAVEGLSVLPTNTIASGTTATGRVRINLPARTGGEIVTISAGSSISAPATVTVPAGSRYADFTIQASAVSVGTQSWLKVSMGGANKQIGVKVRPPVLSAVTLPSEFTGGETVSCTVTLDGVAAVPLTVNLRDNTGALATPASVTIPTGATSVTINIASIKVTSAQVGKSLIASLSGISKTATFTINP